jgi:hypothetical protein
MTSALGPELTSRDVGLVVAIKGESGHEADVRESPFITIRDMHQRGRTGDGTRSGRPVRVSKNAIRSAFSTPLRPSG